MDFIIRNVADTDLEAITAIYADAVLNGSATYELEPPSLPEMTARCHALTSRHYPYLVAEGDGRILGYAYAGPFRPRPAYRFIVEDSVYIAPAAKGRGLGKALLTKLVDRCEALGFRQMVAVIGDGNRDSPSVRLHETLGFRHSGLLAGSGFKHGRWLDTIFMQLEMNGGASLPPDPDSLAERNFKAGR